MPWKHASENVSKSKKKFKKSASNNQNEFKRFSEKDAARCSKIENKNIWVLKTEADLPMEFAHKIANKMKENQWLL